MRIRVLLSENQIAEEFLAAVKGRDIPEKFFYWFPLSVRAWLNLCRDGAYRNFVRSDSLIRTYARDIAAAMPKGEIHLISLGSGQGSKDIHILKALRDRACLVTYRPLDSSLALLEMACAEAEALNFDCEGIKADISKADQLRYAILPSTEAPRLYLFLGNTFGAFDPPAFSLQLRELLRPQDLILLDGEIYAGDETLAGYDNPVNRAFALGPLVGAGLAESHGELMFAQVEDARLRGFYRLTKHFRIDMDCELRLAGERINFRPGEKIMMNHSGKFSREGFISLLSDYASLSPRREYLSDDQRFLMVLAAASPAG